MTAVKGPLCNDLDRIDRRNNNNGASIINVPSLAMNLQSPPPSSPHGNEASSPTTPNTMTGRQLPRSSPPRVPSRLPMMSHPYYDINLFMYPSGMMMMPLPPPPYSTLPTRTQNNSRENNPSHQRRLIDTFLQFNSSLLRSSNSMLNRSSSNTSSSSLRQSNNVSQTPETSPGNLTSTNSSVNNQAPQVGNNSQTTQTTTSPTTTTTRVTTPTMHGSSPPILPSYHHLYSSSSPASMRRRRRRMLRQQRIMDPTPVSLSSFTSDPTKYLSENRKYLVFVTLFIIGIVLTFVGVVTLSLFTISFGFTFILFSLLLYKLLPSSKYAPRGGSNPQTMFTLERNPGGRSRSPLAISCIPYSAHPRSLQAMMHLPPHAIHGPHHPLHLSHAFPGSHPHHGPAGFLLNAEPPVAFALPPPPPSYQEALTAGHTLIQPLNAASLQDISQQQQHQTNNSSQGIRVRGEMSSQTYRSRSNVLSNNNNNSEVTVTTSGVTVEPTTVITVEALTHRTDEDLPSPDLVSSCHTSSRLHEVPSSSVCQQDHLQHNNRNSSVIMMPTSGASSQRGLVSSQRGNKNNNNCVTICSVNDGDKTCSFDGYSSLSVTHEASNRLQTRMSSTQDLQDSCSSSDDRHASRLHFVTIIEATI